MTQEQNFMMVYRFTPDFSHRPTEEELAQMQQQWGTYIGGIAQSGKLVSTHRLGFEGKCVLADGTVKDEIVVAEGQIVSGNMVVKADSFEEAVELAKGCPILHAGGSVEVRPIMPMG